MTCRHYIDNQCHLILEWQPDRLITERFCQDICVGRFDGDRSKLIEWAKSKVEQLERVLTPLQKQLQEKNRICDECQPQDYCALKDRLKCKRGRPGYFCPENKW